MTNANAPKPPEAPKVKRCGVCGSPLVLNRLFARPDSWVCVKAGCPAWRWDDEKAPGAWSVLRKPAPTPEPKQGSEEPDYEAALTEVFNRAPIKGEEHLMVPKVAYLALRAQLAQAREERDKFEAESEQKGADLMAAEGVIAEIIGAHERSASSELEQLIEDARAARAKESQ